MRYGCLATGVATGVTSPVWGAFVPVDLLDTTQTRLVRDRPRVATEPRLLPDRPEVEEVDMVGVGEELPKNAAACVQRTLTVPPLQPMLRQPCWQSAHTAQNCHSVTNCSPSTAPPVCLQAMVRSAGQRRYIPRAPRGWR